MSDQPGGIEQEDEADRLWREIGFLLRRKFAESKLSDLLMVVSSLLLFIVGIEQGYVAFKAWKDTGPLVTYAGQSADAADKSAKAAEKFALAAKSISVGVHDAVDKLNLQADSTQKIARTSESALISVQRAFLYPTLSYPPVMAADGKTVKGGQSLVTCENGGSTPTRGMTLHFSHNYLDELPEGFRFPDLWGPGKQVAIPAYVGPKGKALVFSDTLTVDQLTALTESPTQYYMWGWARYHDVFDGTKQHITRYCYQITVTKDFSAGHPLPDGLLVGSTNCPVGNC